MTTFGVSMVRNEIDVIEGVVRHTAGEVDELIIADNGSTDGTREVLDELSRHLPLTVVDDPEVAYYQSVKMTALAEQAAGYGATWIVPFDADELWYSRLGRIRDVLASFKADTRLLHADLYNHLASSIDEVGCPFESMVWRQREPGFLPKMAFRWEPGAVIEQGNHGVRLAGNVFPIRNVLELRHFPARSAEQFVAKSRQGAAAYAAANLPEDMGAHWRSYGRILDNEGDEGLAKVWWQHWWYRSPVDAGLIRDPAPYRRWEDR